MKKEWVRVCRTLIQVLVPLAAAAPLLVDEIGLSATSGLGASLLAASAVLTRLMSVPAVEQAISRLLREKSEE